jgi:hypothetical protein
MFAFETAFNFNGFAKIKLKDVKYKKMVLLSLGNVRSRGFVIRSRQPGKQDIFSSDRSR